jgi:hypothetical protein
MRIVSRAGASRTRIAEERKWDFVHALVRQHEKLKLEGNTEDRELNVELEVVRGGQHEELELELEGTVKCIRAGTCAPE